MIIMMIIDDDDYRMQSSTERSLTQARSNVSQSSTTPVTRKHLKDRYFKTLLHRSFFVTNLLYCKRFIIICNF